jgi:hypothetical protein
MNMKYAQQKANLTCCRSPGRAHGIGHPRTKWSGRRRAAAIALVAWTLSMCQHALFADCTTEIDPYYWTVDVASFIHVTNSTQVAAVRNRLIAYLWKQNGWPATNMPASVLTVPTPGWVSGLGSTNIDHVDRMDILMDYGLHSIVYHIRAAQSSNRLLLYHYGHGGGIGYGEDGWQETMRQSLDAGYDVMVFWMPLLGENSTVAQNVPGYGAAAVPLVDHNRMAVVLENAKGSFIRFFVEPVVVAINYAKARYNYADVNMVGLSGGGWTTHLCAAIDPRIEYSFPVAGSLPLYLRVGPCPNGSVGDAEQEWAPLYQDIASWLDIYILGGTGEGRQQIHILNQFDTCCFWGIGYQTYEAVVSNVVASIGPGLYRVYSDSTQPGDHQISPTALESVILPSLANKGLRPSPQFIGVLASDVTATNALLSAQLEGATADVSIYWDTSDRGTDLQAWSQSSFAAFPNIAAGESISNTVSNLMPGTAYYFRFYATNSTYHTTAWSAAQQFTTAYTLSVLANFSSQMRLSFKGDGGSEVLSNFPVVVALSSNINGSGFAYGGFASPSGGDLRFFASDGTTPLNYEVENWDTGGVSFVWVAVPSLSSTNDSIWAYWGNPVETNYPAYALDGSTWSNGFAGVWHLKEDAPGTGTSALYSDSTSGRHAGDDFVSATGKSGIVGAGQQFNGSNDFIAVPDFDLAGKFTISAWVKSTQVGPGTRQIVARGDNADHLGAYLAINGGELLGGGNNGSGWNSSDISGGTIADGNWHYVAGVYDQAASSVTGYVDGQARLTKTITFDGNGYSPKNTKFGRNQIAGVQFLDGYLDEIQIANVPRSSNWIWNAWLNMASNSAFCDYGHVGLPGPFIRITSPTNDAVFVSPVDVALSATITDSNAVITRVDFYQGTVQLGEATASPYTFTWTNAPAGSYTLSAVATEDGGIQHTSLPVAISVVSDQPLAATPAAPGKNASFTMGTTVPDPTLSIQGRIGPIYTFLLQGQPGFSYVVQTTTNFVDAGSWTDSFGVSLTNSWQTFDWTNQDDLPRFFRAVVK